MLRVIAIATGFSLAGAAEAEVLHHWTQLIEGDTQSFRVIVDDDYCPSIVVDGAAQPMTVRAGPHVDFPNTVCEHLADRSVTGVSLGARRFPLAPASPKRIVIVGDTGCRLKEGEPIQDCADPVAWPFAAIARSVAAVEADLAIHVGDYHYREMKCPDPGVCGSVFGYNWPTWEADFFADGQPMLARHPFVFVRGNHEKCGRAWLGYLRYLGHDPIRAPLRCDNYDAAFVVDFDDLQLGILDSSTRDRSTYTWDRLRAMRDQFIDLLPRIDRETWLVTHAPLWGYGNTKVRANAFETLETIQREAFGAAIPRLVSAVVAGDLHFAQVITSPGNPTQVTLGNGGVALYTTPVGHDDDVAVGYGVAGDVFGYNDFGFGLIDRGADGGRLTMFDESGAVVATCSVSAGADSCAMK